MRARPWCGLLLLLLGCESARKLGYWCLGRCGLQLKKHETFFSFVFLKEEYETILTYLGQSQWGFIRVS
jgi:hypothetical protein